MNGLLNVVEASMETGLIFSILAMGVMITNKILDISDLSVEGTFPLGAFVFSFSTMANLNPMLGIGLSFLVGMLSGLFAFILIKYIKIKPLLAGILNMTILYSLNLRIVGKSNVTLFDGGSIFKMFQNVPQIVVILFFVVIVKLVLDWFFKTEKGYLLIATGDNTSFVKSLGKNPENFVMRGLMIANGLVSLSGALMAQYQSFADVNMGQTMIVTALASIIIGDSFLKNNMVLKNTTRAIIGASIYRIIIGFAMYLGMKPGDLKAITALIVIIFIAYNNMTEKIYISRRKENVGN